MVVNALISTCTHGDPRVNICGGKLICLSRAYRVKSRKLLQESILKVENFVPRIRDDRPISFVQHRR